MAETMTTAGVTATAARHDDVLGALQDRSEIEALVHQLGAALEEGAFDRLRDLLTADSTATTPGGVATGIDAVTAQAARNHDPALSVEHLITGVLIDLDGDAATVRANVVATFAAAADAAPHERLGGVYGFDARRTADGWRLASVRATPRWKEGEPLTPRG